MNRQQEPAPRAAESDSALDALVTHLGRAGTRAGVAKVVAELTGHLPFHRLRQHDELLWSTTDVAPGPDWSEPERDVDVLAEAPIGYTYDGQLPALEIRLPALSLRHVGRGHGGDLLRAHQLAALLAPAPDGRRFVLVSRRHGAALGWLDEPVSDEGAVEWLRQHAAPAFPLHRARAMLRGSGPTR